MDNEQKKYKDRFFVYFPIGYRKLCAKMNPYQQKRRWKIALVVLAVLIGTASVFYSNFFVKKMEREEAVQFKLWTKVAEQRMRMYDNEQLTEVFETIKKDNKMDVIITKPDGSIYLWEGLDSTKTLYANNTTKEYDSLYFVHQLQTMKRQHPPQTMKGIDGEELIAYYKDSSILTQLRYFPYIQLGVIAVFLLVAYLAFSASRRAEQDQVWVGLTKETAHQLGTPISSLMAWIELIRERLNPQDESLVLEMENDIKRLEMIADRFSKVGSQPILEDHVVYQIVQDYVNYYKVRTSDKIKFELAGDTQVRALLSVPLFEWVIENLLKNAVNAIGNEGLIQIEITENIVKEEVFIDVTDSGKGIEKGKFESVFKPGYTTRKRGWGLGLSLTKRIVERYHKGQIYVLSSELGKGTTFRIVLKSSITYEPTTNSGVSGRI